MGRRPRLKYGETFKRKSMGGLQIESAFLSVLIPNRIRGGRHVDVIANEIVLDIPA